MSPPTSSSSAGATHNDLSPAFANRFDIVTMADIDSGDGLIPELSLIAAHYLGFEVTDPTVAEVARTLVKAGAELQRQQLCVTLRTYCRVLDCVYRFSAAHPQESLKHALQKALQVSLAGQVEPVAFIKTVCGGQYDRKLLPQQVELKVEGYTLTESRSVYAEQLLGCVQARQPVLLEGSAAVGKTRLITVLAKSLGQDLERTNNTDSTTVQVCALVARAAFSG